MQATSIVSLPVVRALRAVVILAALMIPIPATARAAPRAQRPLILQEAFSTAAADGLPKGWDVGTGGWQVRAGALESDGMGRSTTMPLAAPAGRRLRFEAVVRLHRATGKEWKLAGLTAFYDDSNYWHLALAEGPDTLGRRHFAELSEMRDGNWLAQANLAVTDERGMELNWKYDHPYRLRIDLAPDGIAGTICELDGTVLARKAYRFGLPAVTTGRPALVTADLTAAFRAYRAEIAETAPPPPKPVFPAYRRAGDASAPHGRATGYFHVERQDGRWWIVDPRGTAFYAVGTDHVNYYAHFCEKLGYAPYNRNVAAKFGTPERWAADAIARLQRWGFNTLGAGCIPVTWHRGLPHTAFLSLGTGFTAISSIAPRTTWTGFPDVFHPRFASWCEREARRQCVPQRDDPWLLGYFLDNELEWFGKNGAETGLVDETFRRPAEHPAKRALIALLRRRYPDIAALNRAWKADCPGWEALAQNTEPPQLQTPAARRDGADFVRLIAERYFAVTTAAIRKVDPHHMVLGCRFAGYAPPGAIGAAGRHCDIVSVNYYGQVDLRRNISPDMPATMRRYYAEAQRPLMLTEWSFPALDAGLPSQHGAGQRVATQAEKARCFAVYQRALFSLPFMVGSDYFMWADEPALGISSTFPEDSNYGLVDERDNPWRELTQTAAHVNRQAERLHGADTAELQVQIADDGATASVLVANHGRRAAAFTLRVTLQGRASRRRLALPSGGSTRISLPAGAPAFVVAEADPEETVLETDRSDNRAEQVIHARSVRSPALLVVNPSPQPLTDVPVAVRLNHIGADWRVPGLETQLDALPDGQELCVRVPELPALSVTVLPLARGATTASRHTSGGDRSLRLEGPLRLEHDAGSGDLFDRISLEGLPLGRFRAVVHQAGSQSLWVSPDRVLSIDTWEGPVRTVLQMTAGLEAGTGEAKTAVNAAGVYAAQERRPARFRTTYRLTRYADESWFDARFLSLQNTDDHAWRFASYYYYPLSAIGGSAADDQPRSAEGAPLWYDVQAGAGYGAVIDTARLRSTFWKDTPDGAGEHPDIWREIGLDLAPGQTYRATGADAGARIFGGRGADTRPGGDTLTRLNALAQVRANAVFTTKPPSAPRGKGVR